MMYQFWHNKVFHAVRITVLSRSPVQQIQLCHTPNFDRQTSPQIAGSEYGPTTLPHKSEQ